MFCPFCGSQNRDDKRFCRQCGKTLPAPRSRGVISNALPATEESVAAPEPAKSVADLLEPTGQLLPDTVDLPVLGTLPPLFSNGSERPANGAVAGLEQQQDPLEQEQFADDSENTSGEFMSTDELELDKTLDKTVETPVLEPPSCEPGEERPRAVLSSSPASSPGFNGTAGSRASRPILSFVSSLGPGEDLEIDRGLRVERMTLAISAVAMIIGVAILVWLLFLKS
jgi:hypothetical protein